MEKKPEFFIIAGPNGAGKSRNGHIFVPASLIIFNGDLVFADLCKRYPNYDRDILQGGVAKALEDARDKALSSRADFAFESNYSSDMATNITETFKNAGYKATLVYFGLERLKNSIARVKARFEKGGHNIKPADIRYNFEEGIKRVNKDLKLFDEILFVDTQNQNVSIPQNINWYKKHFEKTVNKLKLPSIHMKKIRIRTNQSKKGFGI